MYPVKNFNTDDRWIIFFPQNQGGFASVHFPVNFDAPIYIFWKLLKQDCWGTARLSHEFALNI